MHEVYFKKKLNAGENIKISNKHIGKPAHYNVAQSKTLTNQEPSMHPHTYTHTHTHMLFVQVEETNKQTKKRQKHACFLRHPIISHLGCFQETVLNVRSHVGISNSESQNLL